MSVTLADAIIRILPDDTELGPGFQKAKASAQTFASDLSGKVVAATKVAVAGIIGLGAGAVATGPDLSGLNSDDSYHIMTDVNLAAAAALWYAAIAAAYY